ncbi:MAG: hypothetical protein E6Q97_00595 [Desulfurellales bacterium]|nr:MAG: hypothetical protein E6Q97_00595 [Desulfurellales bacterium]
MQRGLGDTIEAIAEATGVAAAVEAVVGECGGCQQRRDWLNRVFPYHVCGDAHDVIPFTGPVVRNLMMHIYPVRAHQFWRWNVDQVRSRMHLFNGHRAIAVVTDETTDSLNDVQRSFGDDRIDTWIVDENRSDLRETHTWHRLISACHSCDPNTITFTCHAKGVRGGRSYDDPGVDRRNPTSLWAACMYETCLDGHRMAEQLLERNVFAGSLKVRGAFGGGSWHYAGTFYWFRNAKLFAMPNWHEIENVWYGTETYPGTKVGWGQAGCIFGERVGSMYEESEWERLLPQWMEWRKTHLSG